MTFGLCVREPYIDEQGAEQTQFGVIVTTRLPCIGVLCPFVSEDGVLSVQSYINAELGTEVLALLGKGLTITDSVSALLNVDEAAAQLQVHGLDAESQFAYSGDDCRDWYGHLTGENYSIAGNLLASESVITAVANCYEEDESDRPLPERLIDALEAGQEEGGDGREDLRVQSVALGLKNTEGRASRTAYYNYHHDLELQIDASETPFKDLRTTYELACEGFEIAKERYN